jgi:hypothetical protein
LNGVGAFVSDATAACDERAESNDGDTERTDDASHARALSHASFHRTSQRFSDLRATAFPRFAASTCTPRHRTVRIARSLVRVTAAESTCPPREIGYHGAMRASLLRHIRGGRVASRLFLPCAAVVVVACSGSNQAGLLGDDDGGGPGTGVDGGGTGVKGDGGSNTSDGGAREAGTDGGATGMPGEVDKVAACDTGLAIDGDATSFAKALGVCTNAAKDGYGLVSASYSKGFGVTDAPVAEQWGILPSFGSAVMPREGASIGVLSTGYARAYDSAAGTATDFVNGTALYAADPTVTGVTSSGPGTGTAPPNFPKAVATCPQSKTVNDMIDVKLTLQAPKDATGFQLDFDFYASDWPNYVCSVFNDAFLVYVTSQAIKGDTIATGPSGEPISVNVSYFDRCTAQTAVGCSRSNNGSTADPPLATAACAGGVSELAGTGYGDSMATTCTTPQTATVGGATGWLTARAPVTPGETFTLELMIWDAGDGLLDSSVLVDNFKWLGGGAVKAGTTR